MNDNPMYEKYVEISWCPADIQAIRPNWSDERCMQELQRIARYVEDSSIEGGWESIESLLEDDLCDECGEPMGDDQSPNVKTMCVYCEDEMLKESNNEIN